MQRARAGLRGARSSAFGGSSDGIHGPLHAWLGMDSPRDYDPSMRLPVVLRPGEDGWIVAECSVIPGCITQGRTRTEALENIREAIELALENQTAEGWRLPETYEIVEVTVAA